jgi:hypothetical protein
MPYTVCMKGNLLTQQVHFIIGVCCLGSVALLAITVILNASEMENPVVDAMVASGLAEL